MQEFTAQKAGAAPRGFWGIAAPAFPDCLPGECLATSRGSCFAGICARVTPVRLTAPRQASLPARPAVGACAQSPLYRAVPGVPPRPEQRGFRTGGN